MTTRSEYPSSRFMGADSKQPSISRPSLVTRLLRALNAFNIFLDEVRQLQERYR
jgi:hypothetical protein